MRKKITSIALFALVASMIMGSIPNYAYADSQSDSLIRIASQARDQVKIQLSKVDATQEIKDKFQIGSVEIRLLIEASKNEDVPAYRQHFLSAMTIFNEIIQQISEISSTSDAALSSSQTVVTSSISHELDRLERYIDRLKGIAIRNGIDIDSSYVDKLIDKTRNEIEEGNSVETSTIKEIKQSIADLNNSLREKTREYTTDRAKSLVEKHLEDLDRLIAEAKDMRVSQGTLDKLMEARDHLNSVSDTSNVTQIIDEVKKLISIKKQFEDTKMQRIQVRSNQLESTYERLSNYADEIPELNKAENMLLELRALISEKKSYNAIRVLNSLNDLLNELENSISTVEEVVAIEGKKISNLADSKIERIKIKIDRLETSMNNLVDEIEENAAAKRWLNNAFSLLEDAKNHVDDSPDNALKIIMSIEQIIKRIQTTMQ